MYEAAVWLRSVDERLPVEIDWRYFPLEQVNSRSATPVWEKPESNDSSLYAFRGAEAARRQGAEAFERYHYAMLRARHENNARLNRNSVLEVAEEAGLDMTRFEKDMDAPGVLDAVKRDYEEARAQGVFGTPTIFFGPGQGAYLKMRPATTGDVAVPVYERFRQTVTGELNIQEIKRPG